MVPGNGKESGLTLLEMLVAMALMGVLAVSLYASLHIGFRARRSAAAALEPVRTAELAMELVRQDIESALPPTGILAGEFIGQDAKDDLQRDADMLLLHSSAHGEDDGQSAPDIRRIELAVTSLSDGTGNVLLRRTTTNLLAPEMVQAEEEVLCRRVMAFNLRYFDGSDWLDNWDSSTQGDLLPLAIEVTLEVERPEATTPAAGGYRLSRVFLLPCSIPAAEEGTQVIRSSPR